MEKKQWIMENPVQIRTGTTETVESGREDQTCQNSNFLCKNEKIGKKWSKNTENWSKSQEVYKARERMTGLWVQDLHQIRASPVDLNYN